MHCDEMWAYWNGTLKSGILLRMWDILTSKKGHCDWILGHCDGTGTYLDGAVLHFHETVGHCDGSVGQSYDKEPLQKDRGS